ncbi:GDSL-type esterase/lipase family protein [Neobacillus sp. SuZ13]|uniref:GDSL-type esterase/lipase family protein n=1 Tax=Neobacillus sp. SuZ13 TaxID=3047875 RepID=UPI0024C057CC|nr:GDSL-type esterase/lipase family protein [Neobacillus sp. SuZ13]WHY66764.1 GDSL-type esterase/lipase family protein [Neobacillus sp. SuZ13]
MKKSLFATICTLMMLSIPLSAYAHPGRTDSNGGHYCWTNCEKWGLSYGEYHYPGGKSPSESPKESSKVKTISVKKSGWKKTNGKRYYYVKGVKQKGWKTIDSKRYYFDKNGVMKIGWLTYKGSKYYLDKNGVMKKGWITVKGKKYYLTKSGVMKTGWITVSGKKYYLDKSGVMKTGWITVSGKKYYLDKSGVMKKGWITVSGKKYYLDSSGVMKKGWITVSGKKYYLDKSGVMKTGWITVSGKKYYLDKSGVMKKGWITVSGKKYYLDSSGVMKKGWITVSGKKYYLDGSGVMKTGWITVSGKKYYLDGSGVMKTGWVLVSGKWYYLDSTGVMKTGWLDLSGKRYYLNTDGSRVTGWKQISVKWYYFNKDGVMAANTTVDGYKLGADGARIQVQYVALGDSLAAGMTPYGIDRIPVDGVDLDWGYPNYISEKFTKSYQLLDFDNFGVSGYKTDDVIADFSKANVQKEIKEATHLTIDIGANDLLAVLPAIQANPAQAPTEIGKITANLNAILSAIDQLNPNVKVYVMGYYNPFPYVTDVQQKAQLEQLLLAFNGQIQAQAVQNGDTFVPTAQVINVANFADYLPNPLNIHLSLAGYQVVSEEFWKVMN